MNENHSFDAIMAGGGLMGCATAYYLLKLQPGLRVAIVEMDPSYERNSTVLSDGNIRLQFNVKENIQVSQYGLQVFASFAEDMAVDDWRPEIAFRQQGNLFLADQAGKDNALAGLAQQQALGCEVIWLEPQQIAARFPLYAEAQVAGGAFGALDGTMDPSAVLQGYKRKAVALGASFLHAQVASLEHAGRQINGVRLADGRSLSAPFVVNSAGAWCTQLARSAGIELPIDPVRRQVFMVETNTDPQEIYPLTVFPSGLYTIQEHHNRFLVGKSFEDDPVGFDFTWNRSRFLEQMWPELVEQIPAFDQLRVESGWSGLYDVNHFDGNMLLGEWPGLQGFLLANGFSGHGFQQGPAVGRFLAEHILGLEHVIDLSIFSPQRLLDSKPVFEGQGKLV